jgi:hypothetical protein
VCYSQQVRRYSLLSIITNVIEKGRIKLSEGGGYAQTVHVQLQYLIKGAQFEDRGHLQTVYFSVFHYVHCPF